MQTKQDQQTQNILLSLALFGPLVISALVVFIIWLPPLGILDAILSKVPSRSGGLSSSGDSSSSASSTATTRGAASRSVSQIYQDGLVLTGERDYSAALKEFDTVIKSRRKGPTDSDYFWRGTCYRHLGQYQDALNDFDKAIRMSRNATNLIGRGVAYAENGQNEEALADFSASLKLASKELIPWIYIYKGIVYLDSGRPEQALQQFNQSLRVEIGSKAYIWRAKYYIQRDQLDLALGDLNNAIKYDTKHRRKGEPYFYRAQVYEKLSKPDLAEADRAEANQRGVPARFD